MIPIIPYHPVVIMISKSLCMASQENKAEPNHLKSPAHAMVQMPHKSSKPRLAIVNIGKLSSSLILFMLKVKKYLLVIFYFSRILLKLGSSAQFLMVFEKYLKDQRVSQIRFIGELVSLMVFGINGSKVILMFLNRSFSTTKENLEDRASNSLGKNIRCCRFTGEGRPNLFWLAA